MFCGPITVHDSPIISETLTHQRSGFRATHQLGQALISHIDVAQKHWLCQLDILVCHPTQEETPIRNGIRPTRSETTIKRSPIQTTRSMCCSDSRSTEEHYDEPNSLWIELALDNPAQDVEEAEAGEAEPLMQVDDDETFTIDP